MHVLVATDGSPEALEATRRGLAILGRPSRVTLLHVLEEVPGEDAGGFESSVLTDLEQQAVWSEARDRAAAVLAATGAAAAGAEVESMVEVGDAAASITRVATERGADVILVGSHERSGIGRILLGSVSEHVVRHAPCPVLVVRG